MVRNREGWRELTPDGGTSGGEGYDPLLPYGPRAAADLVALEAKQHVGDVVVLGRFDPQLREVCAFEELVGSHGGLGGWQTDALLVVPAALDAPGARGRARCSTAPRCTACCSAGSSSSGCAT